MHLALVLIAILSAQTAPDTPEAEALRKRLIQDRIKTQFLKREEASILQGLENLDRQLWEKKKKSEDIGAEKTKIEKRIGTLDQEIAKNEEEIGVLHTKAGRRAAAMHRLRRTRLTELFERIKDPSELRRLRDRLRIVLAYDADLITATRSASESARAMKAELGEKEKTLDAKKKALEVESGETTVLREERAALLDGVKKERGASERLASELIAASKKLEKEIGVMRGQSEAIELQPGGFSAQAGKLPWPVQGRVEVPFGKKVDPASGMVMVQKGIDIRAPLATPIRAVFGGTVAYAAWFEGFGRLVIIDHGGGYFTLYAHLEDLEVKKGQAVNAFQVLGLLGDSGSTKGAYLYFEIRVGKDAVDPLKWLAL
jgi:septal ring factor EnvC (AmiA/AmiB activator)